MMVLNLGMGDLADDGSTTKYIENIRLVKNGYFYGGWPLY